MVGSIATLSSPPNAGVVVGVAPRSRIRESSHVHSVPNDAGMDSALKVAPTLLINRRKRRDEKTGPALKSDCESDGATKYLCDTWMVHLRGPSSSLGEAVRRYSSKSSSEADIGDPNCFRGKVPTWSPSSIESPQRAVERICRTI